MKTLVFGFQGNFSEDLLGILDVENFYVISKIKEKFNIDEFLEYLKQNNPERIVGLGVYYGRDKEKIRLETITSNKFRNGVVGEIPSYKLDNFLKNPELKIAKGMGNSWCNLVSYKVMALRQAKQITSKYDFLHIPQDMNLFTIVGIITTCLL